MLNYILKIKLIMKMYKHYSPSYKYGGDLFLKSLIIFKLKFLKHF